MERVARVFAVIAVVHLASGAPDALHLLIAPGVSRYVGVAALGCFLLGISGCLLLFRRRFRASRCMLLWALGVSSLVYATEQLTISFPAWLKIPVTFGGVYEGGEFSYFGVDLMFGVIFVAIWIACPRGEH
jgi:hypothetical protein